MSAQDYRVNAEVRRVLASRWVDVSRLQIGTTNGVVYLLGTLDTTAQDPGRRPAEPRPDPAQPLVSPHLSPTERLLRLAMTLEKQIRRIRDVRDVVFKLDNVFKRGGRWRVVETQLGAQETGS